MKRSLLAVFALALALSFGIENAEAARMGGGKSIGMQRQSVAPKPTAPVQQAIPAKPAAPVAAPAPAATPKRSWLGPIAGLAAGLGIAALLSHFGLGESVANFMMLALLALAAVVVIRLLLRRWGQRGAASDPLQYAGAGMQPANVNLAPSPSFAEAGGVAAARDVPRIPADFDVDAFLQVAKLNFTRLQAAHDAGNIQEIRDFVAPELFAEISLQVAERGGAAQQTDVVTLNAELLEVVTQGDRHIASVYFTGMIRERVGAAVEPFGEVWNLSKPSDGRSGWIVAGIQQMS